MSYYSTLSLQPVFYNGALVIGAKIFVYDAGTNTPRVAYTNEALTVPHTAPFLTDANGVIPPFWVASGAGIKVVLKNPDDTVIRTIDGIPTKGINSTTVSQIKRALAQSGVMQTVSDAVSADVTSSVNIQWESGVIFDVNDDLYNFIKSTLSYSDAQMAALIQSANSKQQ